MPYSMSGIWIGSFLFLFLRAPCALALDPTQPTANFSRTIFTVDDGLPTNVVNAILQSRDGFLWIGTDSGLVRFNGRDFTPIDFRKAGSVSQVVGKLAEGPDGSLWVQTNIGIVRIPDIEHYDPDKSTSRVYLVGDGKDERLECLKFTRDGTLFAGTTQGLYRLSGAHFIPVVSGIFVEALEEASNGNLLMVANNDFLEWDRNRTIKHPELGPELAPTLE